MGTGPNNQNLFSRTVYDARHDQIVLFEEMLNLTSY